MTPWCIKKCKGYNNIKIGSHWSKNGCPDVFLVINLDAMTFQGTPLGATLIFKDLYNPIITNDFAGHGF